MQHLMGCWDHNYRDYHNPYDFIWKFLVSIFMSIRWFIGTIKHPKSV